MKKCERKECSVDFEPKPYWQRYCGIKCRDRVNYERKRDSGYLANRIKLRKEPLPRLESNPSASVAEQQDVDIAERLKSL